MISKSLKDLEASFSIIVSNVDNYYSGNKHAYLPVAVELRKLLCDTQRRQDNSLLKRLLPNLRLKPLHGSQDKFDEHTVLYIPGKIWSNGKGYGKVDQIINEGGESLEIDNWLSQRLVDNATTIKDFIRPVADKEGAHSDEEYNAPLRKTKTIRISKSWSLCDQYIVVLGRYLTKALAIWMLNSDLQSVSNHIRSQYNKVGRGCAILDLDYFGHYISEGVPLDYKNYEGLVSLISIDADNSKKVEQLINSYDVSSVFLFIVKDINSETWLYQQRMK